MSKLLVKRLENDRRFNRFVELGWLVISKSGSVFNTLTNNYVGTTKPDCKNGYVRISFYHPKSGRCYRILLHRLVWIVYKGLIPPDKEVNHKNGDKLYNRLSNLELLTPVANKIHGVRNFGVRLHGVSYGLTDYQVKRIRKLYKNNNISQLDLAHKFFVSEKCVYNVVHHLSYKHV
jgi:hypothetical protein